MNSLLVAVSGWWLVGINDCVTKLNVLHLLGLYKQYRTPCDVNADCQFTGKDIQCQCRQGFKGDGYKCEGQLALSKTHDRRTRNSYEKLALKPRTRNLPEIEQALFDARNSREKYLAASRYDTRTSFSSELTRTSFLYEFFVRVSWA